MNANDYQAQDYSNVSIERTTDGERVTYKVDGLPKGVNPAKEELSMNWLVDNVQAPFIGSAEFQDASFTIDPEDDGEQIDLCLMFNNPGALASMQEIARFSR